MYTGLLHTHSYLRYIILVLLVAAIIRAVYAWVKKADYTKLDDRLGFWSMLFVHFQVLLGIWLYVISPKVQFHDFSVVMKNEVIRYFTVEHILLMLIVASLVTIGRVQAKKKAIALAKHRAIAIYFSISLLIIVVAVYVMLPQ